MKLYPFVLVLWVAIAGCAGSEPRQDQSVVQQSTEALAKGDLGRAEAAALVALDISPYNAQAAYNLARVYEQTSRPQDALQMYRLIVASNTQAPLAPELSAGKESARLIDIAVEKLKAEQQAKEDRKDADNDGVADNRDRCPDTPAGARVDNLGCWTLLNLFDPGKTTIKPENQLMLDEVAAVLRSDPKLNLEVQGHTDNTGSEAYNRTLSGQRALTVVNYLKNKGIAGARLTAKGYGFQRPQDSNETEEGKARNRRIEFVKLNK